MSLSIGRIFLTELNGNPNRKNSRDETCLHILCCAQSAVTAEEQDARLCCIELLLQWSGPPDETSGTEERLDLGAADGVS